MKKEKSKRKMDFEAARVPNSELTGELEQWEAAVIKTATHFTVCKMRGPSLAERRTTVYRTFLEAHQVAGRDPQSLIYAITEEGRWCCVPRKVYSEICLLWHQLHPMDLESHVFSVTVDNQTDWFNYANGRTTGPWPHETQAALVSTLMNSLRADQWYKYSPADRAMLARSAERVNEVISSRQGRAPLEVLAIIGEGE